LSGGEIQFPCFVITGVDAGDERCRSWSVACRGCGRTVDGRDQDTAARWTAGDVHASST
jgi:hypothetical protein